MMKKAHNLHPDKSFTHHPLRSPACAWQSGRAGAGGALAVEQMAGRSHMLQRVGPLPLQQQPLPPGEQRVAAAEEQAG